MAFGTRIATAKRQASPAASAASSLDYQEVAKVAYELYLQRGCANGHDLEDWLKAETLVRQRKSNGRSSSQRR